MPLFRAAIFRKDAGGFHHFNQLLVLSGYIAVILPLVGKLAACAVFDSLLCDAEISAAFCAEGIEGAVAEKTVKIFRVCALVTGKKLAFFMTEIGIFFSVPIIFFHG